MLNQRQKLEAISWKARQMNTTYGKLQSILSAAAIDGVYAEYEERVNMKMQREAERIARAKEKTPAKRQLGR